MTAEHRVTAAADAPADIVWDLFMDVARWPQMTRSIEQVRGLDDGPLRVGSQVVIKQPRLSPARWTVTELQPGRSFFWETTSRGVTTVGGHIVEPRAQGATITLTLRQHGPLAPLARALLGRRTRRYVSMELEGFRRTAESTARQSPDGRQ
jgi:uncharacterized membrane protein